MSLKGILVVALLGLLVWTNRDRIPVEYQFWKKAETFIRVQNTSDRDIDNVIVVVWSNEHPLGAIPKGTTKEFKTFRVRDTTEVVMRFNYGPEMIERHVATLTSETGYQMLIAVNYAGVITTQIAELSTENQP